MGGEGRGGGVLQMCVLFFFERVIFFGRSAAFFLSVLLLRPADGEVVVSKPGRDVKIECGVTTSQTAVTWHRDKVKVVGVTRTGMVTKGWGLLRSVFSPKPLTLALTLARRLCQEPGICLRDPR